MAFLGCIYGVDFFFNVYIHTIAKLLFICDFKGFFISISQECNTGTRTNLTSGDT